MHVLQFLKSGHAAPPGGRLNFSKNTDFNCTDFDMCGQRLHRNYIAEFNDTWHNNSMDDVVYAHFLILKIESSSTPWRKIAF